jgi:hypothetical protein
MQPLSSTLPCSRSGHCIQLRPLHRSHTPVSCPVDTALVLTVHQSPLGRAAYLPPSGRRGGITVAHTRMCRHFQPHLEVRDWTNDIHDQAHESPALPPLEPTLSPANFDSGPMEIDPAHAWLPCLPPPLLLLGTCATGTPARNLRPGLAAPSSAGLSFHTPRRP